jgi:hypothetical protein
MMTNKPSEKDHKLSASSQDAAVVKTPAETPRELTEEEIRSVAGGTVGYDIGKSRGT